jgi:PAS domain S-box-containing protein
VGRRRHRWVGSLGFARVAVPLLIVLLGVAGFVVTARAVSRDRQDAAERRAHVQALAVHDQLERARASAIALGNALGGEAVPSGRRFAALVGSATATAGLTVALWVEPVAAGARRAYERRIRAPITRPPGQRVAGPAATYLPATFVTGVPLRRGADMTAVPTLAATLRDPTSVFAGTATPVASLAGQRGFFIVQEARFGHGAGSQGFLVVLASAGWLSGASSLDPRRTAIRLDGRPLSGELPAGPDATRGFAALTRRWTVEVVREPRTALQATLPWLALAWPPATALLVYLLGRGMLRRRHAERQVDDIFDFSPDLLGVVGLDGYIQRVNPAFERTLGYPAAELVSRPFLEHVHPDDRERTAAAFRSLKDGRDVSDFESRHVRPDGEVRWLHWDTRTVPERGLVYAAARDITENRMLAHEQAALRRVATLVAEGHDAEDLFDAVAVQVGQLLIADATRLLRYQEDGSVAVVGSSGAPDAALGLGAGRGELWRRVLQSPREPADGSALVPDPLRAAGIAAAVGVPIVVSGRRWGAIVAAWRHADMAGGDTELRMAQFTELVATAVANAESGAELAASRRRIVASYDEARRRIERDLHDGAQQRLVNTVVLLKLIREQLAEPDESVVAGLVEEATANAQRGMEEVREIARGIHPRILSSGGLAPALAALARRAPIPVALDLQIASRLPENVELTTYYVASEALTNVIRHAMAGEARIAVVVDDGSVTLTVADDGVGGADPASGSGLVGLHDRVAALGGALQVESEPGAGTVLVARIPVTAGSVPRPIGQGTDP